MTARTAIPRKQLLDQLVSAMQSQYGRAALRWMSDTPLTRERITTGIPDLDKVLLGGLPKGSICQISVLKGSGASSLAAHIAAQQETVVYIDADRKMDEARALQLGLTSENCILAYPATLEEAMQMTLAFCKAGVSI